MSFHKHCNFACMTTKSLLLTICYLGCHSWATAQNVDSLFAHVPESVCPILVQSNRLDLLDLYNSRMKAVTPNLYGGQTILAEKSENFLKLQQTESTDWCMKLYKAPQQAYILVCQTFRLHMPKVYCPGMTHNGRPRHHLQDLRCPPRPILRRATR